jgi:type IV secretory pathway VirB10-like protein
MNPGRILRAGITGSAVAHLSVLMLVLFFTEVHPYGSVTAEPITVDIVTPAEAPPVPKKEEPLPEPKAQPSEGFELPSKSASVPAASPPPPAAQQPPAAAPQQQAALATPSPAAQSAGARPLPPPAAPTPGYTPPEPDISIKYHVMLGLPPDLSVAPAKGAKDDYDAQASKKADIDSGPVADFRRHLKTCSKLPPSISPADSVMIRLRVFMAPDGRLSGDPVVLEGSGNLKGLDLRQSAIDALQACQPYTMLPADRYGEWNVLDLSFTPQDFSG